MDDEFFKGIDAELAAAGEQKKAAGQRCDAARRFSEQALAELRPIAEADASKLEQRGISARVTASASGVSFQMRWGDGAEHGLTVAPDRDSGRLGFTRNSTDWSDGRRFTSTSGKTYDAATWKPSSYEDQLKEAIKDYVIYAPKHGGISNAKS